MDSDRGKLFVGGISWDTTEENLRDYFQVYGDVVDSVIMRDRATGRARGFGFVVFADPSVADQVLLEKHTIDGRTVEAKKAVPRDEQQNVFRSNAGGPGPTGQTRTKKIFVGGLASTVTEQDFRKYFQQFGTITDVVVMYDHNTQRTRGFGFITFDSEDAVDKVLQQSFHELHDKMVEVKRAVPKELSAPTGRGTTAGGFGAGAGRGTGYGSAYGQSYNSSPGGSGFGARPDGRYGPSAPGRGAYTYSAPGYGAGGYGGNAGFATGMNGGYGSAGYGAGVPYGNAAGGTYAGGYGGAPGAASYGAASGYGAAASGGYSSLQMGGRSGWVGGTGGYGAASGTAGYGTTGGGYPNAAPWGSVAAPAQPTGTNGGYSGSGYGYSSGESGYITNTASSGGKSGGYGSSGAGYATSGGVGGGGNYPSGYADAYGGSGYADGTWKAADPMNPVGVNSGVPDGGGHGLAPGGAADGAANGPPEYAGSYGAAGRQTPRGPDVRFRPYPSSGDQSN